MLEFQILGLRDTKMRFASMRDGGLVAIQLEEAKRTAETVEDVYRRRAPRGQKASTDTGVHFYQTISGHAVTTEVGFEITVDTSNPQLRKWLAEGTGIYAGHDRITPNRPGGVLGPIRSWVGGGGSGPFFFASIAGMPAQPWEHDAREEAEPLVREVGGRIGRRVVEGLAGL